MTKTKAKAGKYPRRETAWLTRTTYVKVLDYCVDQAAQLGEEDTTRNVKLNFLDVMEIRAYKQAHSQGLTWEEVEQTRQRVKLALPDTNHPMSDLRFLSNSESFLETQEYTNTRNSVTHSFDQLMQHITFLNHTPTKWDISADMNCRCEGARPIVLNPSINTDAPVLDQTDITLFDILNAVYEADEPNLAAIALGIPELDVAMAIRLKDTLNLPTYQLVPAANQYVAKNEARKKPEPTRKPRLQQHI